MKQQTTNTLKRLKRSLLKEKKVWESKFKFSKVSFNVSFPFVRWVKEKSERKAALKELRLQTRQGNCNK